MNEQGRKKDDGGDGQKLSARRTIKQACQGENEG